VTTWSAPAAVEDALWDAARRLLPADVVGGPHLTAAVVDRSKRYTSEREQLASPSSGAAADRDLAARALFFTVADAPKALAVLAELAPAFPAAEPLRVLDLGAGCGAMSLGLVAHLASAPRTLAIDAIDRDARALEILADAVPAAAKTLGVDVHVSTRRMDLPALPQGPYDLILAGTVLNELDDAAARAVVEAAIDRLTDDGALVIVEPALRTTSRALHRLRDAVLSKAHVFAPCTHEHGCPMLADERDWCHEERTAGLPPRAARLAQVTGLRDGAMKYAYLVLRKQPGNVAAGAVRVVGHPHRSKGKLELPVCGPSGLVPLRLLSRHRAPSNRPLERARRGDLLQIDPPPRPDAADVPRDATVRRLIGDTED
jgi:ribosomal protein RSM22 (predicted rRNA methylase)